MAEKLVFFVWDPIAFGIFSIVIWEFLKKHWPASNLLILLLIIVPTLCFDIPLLLNDVGSIGSSKSPIASSGEPSATDAGGSATTTTTAVLPRTPETTPIPTPAMATVQTPILTPGPTEASPTIPQIELLTLIGTGKDMQIIVTGKGFGAAPNPMPFTGNTAYFCFFNAESKWSAGYNGGPTPETSVTLNYISWTDTRIQINGFAGDYGPESGYVNNIGDTVGVTFLNYGHPGYSTSRETTYGIR